MPKDAVFGTAAGDAIQAEKASAFSVELVSTTAEMDGLRADWERLEQLSGAASVFQSFSFVRTWTRHFADDARKRTKLHIVVIRQNGRAVLVLPLVISGPFALRIARLCGDPIAQFSDLLLDPGANARAAFAEALASVAAAGADAIILRRVRADSQMLDVAIPYLRPGTGVDSAPYADLSPYGDYDAYLQSLSKNMRKGLRNRKHHLGNAGEIAFDLFSGGPEARRALGDAIGFKRKWLIQRGAISSAFLDPATKECLLNLAADQDGSGAIVMRMLVNGEPAAIRFGFEYQGTHFAYMSAYDESFSQLSPGKMLMSAYLSHFKERGIDRLDMLPPAGRHKSNWCEGETQVADYTLPLTAAGRAYATLYQERLRPSLRKAWYKLPDAVRSKATALFVSI